MDSSEEHFSWLSEKIEDFNDDSYLDLIDLFKESRRGTFLNFNIEPLLIRKMIVYQHNLIISLIEKVEDK